MPRMSRLQCYNAKLVNASPATSTSSASSFSSWSYAGTVAAATASSSFDRLCPTDSVYVSSSAVCRALSIKALRFFGSRVYVYTCSDVVHKPRISNHLSPSSVCWRSC
ncbi:unnamed protein product [Trichogramma brassicae]|uniref:Uncharacterized protein n=1 Tax=Trichogramma brassicae TaxID=86971 RepID=A0A6H5JAF0_9HYME|nr:unnamed protein product [Trichogramma brassicae]